MIIGEIRRYLRDNNSIRVSRSLRDTAYKAMQVKEKMTAKNNKEPTIEEIAEELDLPIRISILESIVEAGFPVRAGFFRWRGHHLCDGSGGGQQRRQ